MNWQHSSRKNILEGFQYATSAVDLIRILYGDHDTDIELRTFVKDMFVHTMELLWFYRHNPESAMLPKRYTRIFDARPNDNVGRSCR